MERDIGKLEKGLEIVESEVKEIRRTQQDEFQDMRRVQREQFDETSRLIREMHDKFDTFTTQNAKDLVSMRLRFQRLSITVSGIVAVAIFIGKEIFDAAKTAMAQVWIGH